MEQGAAGGRTRKLRGPRVEEVQLRLRESDHRLASET